ncbi:MAG: alpha/beta hydrolase [Actinomycetota bacterium]
MERVDVETLRFETIDGVSLEGDVVSRADPTGAAVVCHPHPLYGGSRHDSVVAAISRALVEAGYRALRFDFRGTGGSAGEHGGGEPEQLDLVAAIDAVAVPGQPLVVAGYSFGADVALSVDDPRVERWVTVAPVLSVFGSFAAASDGRSKTLIAATGDQFRTARDVERATDGWIATDIVAIGAADHFFQGRLGPVEEAVRAAVA